MTCLIISLLGWNTFVLSQNIQLERELIGRYELDGEVEDISGNNNHGALYGGTLQLNRLGEPNGAIFLDRKSFIKISSSFPQIKTEVSIALWVLTQEDSIQTVVSKYIVNGGLGNGFKLLIEDGKVVMGGRDGSTEYRSSGLSSTTVNDSVWHFITGVCREGNWEIWVDGKKENEYISDYKYVDLSNELNLVLGNSPQLKENFFAGALDDLNIYHRALNESEIQLLYEQGKITPKEEIEMRIKSSMTVWEKRGIYEKSEEYIERVNPSTRLRKREELMEAAIQEMGHSRINWEYLTHNYDVDEEELTLTFDGFEPFRMPLSVELAKHYDIPNFHQLSFENVSFGLTERGFLKIVKLDIVKDDEKKQKKIKGAKKGKILGIISKKQ